MGPCGKPTARAARSPEGDLKNAEGATTEVVALRISLRGNRWEGRVFGRIVLGRREAKQAAELFAFHDLDLEQAAGDDLQLVAILGQNAPRLAMDAGHDALDL